MYLAAMRDKGRRRYVLRETCLKEDRLGYRDLFDFGVDPGGYVVYPGGNSFYFKDELVEALTARGIKGADRQLESILLPFLKTDIQRLLLRMGASRPEKGPRLKGEAMAMAQSGLHLFDRRRLFFLRFGRMDSPEAIMRPHKFLNALVGKSRDETEYYFEKLEQALRVREKKQYVYEALDLARHFAAESARLFPLCLDQTRLDEAFLAELCRLNLDRGFSDEPTPGGWLSDYLIRYAIIWFDCEFGQRPPEERLFEEFARRRTVPPPPPSGPAMDELEACRLFSLTREEWRRMGRDGLARIYRRLALRCHPDRGGDQDSFIELKKAYEVLTAGKD